MSHAPKRWSVKGAVFTASLAVIFLRMPEYPGVLHGASPVAG